MSIIFQYKSNKKKLSIKISFDSLLYDSNLMSGRLVKTGKKPLPGRHFPIQNLLNIESRTSSVVISPVISARASIRA